MTIKSVISVNLKMLSAAEEANWPMLDEAARERQSLIESYFAGQQHAATDKSQLASEAVELQSLVGQTDEKIKSLIDTARQSTIAQGLDLNKSFKAVKAYQSNRFHHG